MSHLKLFILSSTTTALLFGSHFVGADDPAPASDALAPQPKLDLNGCVLTATMKDAGDAITIEFVAANPAETPCPVDFRYSVGYTSPASALSRMPIRLTAPVKQESCHFTAAPGRTTLHTVRIEKPMPQAAVVAFAGIPRPQAAAVAFPGIPGSWRVTVAPAPEADAVSTAAPAAEAVGGVIQLPMSGTVLATLQESVPVVAQN